MICKQIVELNIFDYEIKMRSDTSYYNIKPFSTITTCIKMSATSIFLLCIYNCNKFNVLPPDYYWINYSNK